MQKYARNIIVAALVICSTLLIVLYAIHPSNRGETAAEQTAIHAPTPGHTFFLSEDELISKKAMAAKGDIPSMLAIAYYYGLFMDNQQEQDIWLMRAAEAGDMDTRRYLIGRYSGSTSLLERDLAQQLGKKWGVSIDETQAKAN
ncbi:hypothetical protein [Chitinimonas taiwanensis]|uniref:hypothetical protein n=1 Tax=Chitinimonas taiwanensis TaxID=240412 RepID=UPI0035B094D0